MILSAVNFPSSKTVSYSVVRSDGTVLQAYTSTGVTERVVDATAAKSVYQVDSALITGDFQGFVYWKTNDAVPKTAVEAYSYINSSFILPRGLVVTDAGNSTTSFKTDLSATVNETYTGGYLKFIEGTVTSALANQLRLITGYNGTSKIITVTSAFSTIPAANDSFKVINQ